MPFPKKYRLPQKVYRVVITKGYQSSAKRQFVRLTDAMNVVQSCRSRGGEAILFEGEVIWRQKDPEPELGQKNLLADK